MFKRETNLGQLLTLQNCFIRGHFYALLSLSYTEFSVTYKASPASAIFKEV